MFAVFRRLRRPTTIVLLLVGAFVLAELVARLVSDVFVFSIDNLIARELSPLRWANGPLIYDDKLGWRLKPRTIIAGRLRAFISIPPPWRDCASRLSVQIGDQLGASELVGVTDKYPRFVNAGAFPPVVTCIARPLDEDTLALNGRARPVL